MSLAEANKNLKWDTRMTESKINTGELKKEEMQKHLEQLPDLAHNVEKFTIDGKSSSTEESH
ncbi:hypothetical protein ACLVWU_13695 [Bdellovibrio sp. HCB290]|uniref:hypothetical protein n=1 Tax=Bdellovibrio sp. HCB290 TaxID=3394356 RepID=UPI0039B64833